MCQDLYGTLALNYSYYTINDVKLILERVTASQVFLLQQALKFICMRIRLIPIYRQLNFAYSYGRDRNNLGFSMLAWHDKKPFQLKQCQWQKAMNTIRFVLFMT